MKILVTLSDGNDGPEITIQRYVDPVREANQELFFSICSMIEPAIYEALRKCVKGNVFKEAICYWDGQRIKMVRG
jgi:hypothetical protein